MNDHLPSPSDESSAGLPPLPGQVCLGFENHDAIFGYTADQMKAYALAERERCARIADECRTLAQMRNCGALIRKGTP